MTLYAYYDMKKKDILSLIRLDVTREKKPKKNLDDFLIGEEDQHEEIMKKKRTPEAQQKKRSALDTVLGATASEEAALKPNVAPLDWGALNKMAGRDQVKTLKREYLLLLEKMESLTSDLSEEKSAKSEKSIMLDKHTRETKLVHDFLRELVEYIPDAYDLKMQMDTTAWDLKDIRVEYVTKIKSLVTKVKLTDKVIESEMKQILAQKKLVEDELYRAKAKVEELKQQLDFQNTRNHSTVTDENPTVPSDSEQTTNIHSNPSTEPSTYTPEVQKPVELPQTPPNISEEPSTLITTPTFSIPEIPDDVPKYVFLEVDRYIENLPDESKYILEVIGKTGISRNSELKTHIEQSEDEGKKHFFAGGKFVYNDLNNAVKLLKERQLLENTNVKLGSKGGYDFSVYEFTDVGKAVYYKFTNFQPVEPEMTKIKRDHATLEHGYLIKEVANEFKMMGYTVYEDRETCTYKLSNNKRKVFDLIIEKDGEKKHIEVERGTHNEEDFLAAMDKIYEVTKDIYFIAPNEKILYKNTKSKVFKWITDRLGGFDNAKGKIKLNFATFEKVKKRQKNLWEVFSL